MREPRERENSASGESGGAAAAIGYELYRAVRSNPEHGRLVIPVQHRRWAGGAVGQGLNGAVMMVVVAS